MIEVSVVVCTYNPDPARFPHTLSGLRAQTLARDRWEFVLVDNNSKPGKGPAEGDYAWHPNGRLVHEKNPGLQFARLAGVEASRGGIILFVDDDNELAPEYLETAVALFAKHPRMGIAGGRLVGEFMAPVPQWAGNRIRLLAINPNWSREALAGWPGAPAESAGIAVETKKQYPGWAPPGAGMCLRREAIARWLEKIKAGASGMKDRCGDSLSSAGDCELVVDVLEAGWLVGRFPTLSLKHWIPAGRLTMDYLARLHHAASRDYHLLLARRGLIPFEPVPPWSVPIRKARAWVRDGAWRGGQGYLAWCDACGVFDARASLARPEVRRG